LLETKLGLAPWRSKRSTSEALPFSAARQSAFPNWTCLCPKVGVLVFAGELFSGVATQGTHIPIAEAATIPSIAITFINPSQFVDFIIGDY
jgi:hypothetical protein